MEKSAYDPTTGTYVNTTNEQNAGAYTTNSSQSPVSDIVYYDSTTQKPKIEKVEGLGTDFVLSSNGYVPQVNTNILDHFKQVGKAQGVNTQNQNTQTGVMSDYFDAVNNTQVLNNQNIQNNASNKIKSSNDYFDDAMNGKAWTGGDFTRSNIRQWLKAKGINPYSIGGSMRRELRLAMESGDQRRIDTILQTISNSTGKSVFNDAINGRPQPTTPTAPEQKPEQKPGWSMMTDYNGYKDLKNDTALGRSVYQLQANINNAMKGTEGWTDIATDGYAGNATSAAMDKLKLTNADAYNQLYSQYGHLLNTYQPKVATRTSVTGSDSGDGNTDWHSKYSFLNGATQTKLGGYEHNGLYYYGNWRVADKANHRMGNWAMRGNTPYITWDSTTSNTETEPTKTWGSRNFGSEAEARAWAYEQLKAGYGKNYIYRASGIKLQ